jgi:hypothetical protein
MVKIIFIARNLDVNEEEELMEALVEQLNDNAL